MYNILYSRYNETDIVFNTEPTVTQELSERAVRILDADYKAADLPTVVDNNCAQLTKADKSKSLELLTQFKQLFDGSLGNSETSPVRLELRQNYSPYCGRAYPIPKIHLDVFKREVDRLEELGVLKREKDSP